MKLRLKIDDLIDKLSKDQSKLPVRLNNKRRDRRPQYIMACATLIMVITIQVFILGMITLSGIEDVQKNTTRAVNRVNEDRFNDVWGFITEAHLAAKIQSETVKDGLLDTILRVYDTPEKMDRLKSELENPLDTTNIAKIFAAAISDKYMYYDTNYNGLHIIVTYSIDNRQTAPMGYIAATKNTVHGRMESKEYDALKIAAVIKSYTNSSLASEYMLNVLYGYADNAIPFLQVDDRGVPPVYINGMTKQDLYNAYLKSGTSIYDNLVIAAASYIYDRGDIFDIPDMASTGNINNNHKIIVIQRFRASDMLNKNHSAHMHEYDLMIQSMIDEANNSINYKELVLGALMVFWLICVIVIVAVQNSLAHKLELDCLKSFVINDDD